MVALYHVWHGWEGILPILIDRPGARRGFCDLVLR